MGGLRYRQGTEFRSQKGKGPRDILDAFKSTDMEEQELNESGSTKKVNIISFYFQCSSILMLCQT